MKQQFEKTRPTNPMEFSFKDHSIMSNSRDMWKNRSQRTKSCVLNYGGESSINHQDNDKLKDIIRKQRFQIDQLKDVNQYIVNNSPQNSQRQEIYQMHSNSKLGNRLKVPKESPIKSFNYTPSTIQYRNQSPSYSQMYSRRTYYQSPRIQNSKAIEFYELKITNLNQIIQYQQKQIQFVQNQYSVKQMQLIEDIRCLELIIKQQKEIKQLQMQQFKDRVEEHMINSKNQNQQTFTNLTSKFRPSIEKSLTRVINICLSNKQYQQHQKNINKLTQKVTDQQQYISNLKNKTIQQSQNLKQQIKKLSLKISNYEHSQSEIKDFNMQSSRTVPHTHIHQQQITQLRNQVSQLNNHISELNRTHNRQMVQLASYNSKLRDRNKQYQIQILTFKQNESNKIIDTYNNESNKQLLQFANQKIQTLVRQIDQLKMKCKLKDQDIRRLVFKYEEIEAKLVEIVKVNQRFNILSKVIIEQNGGHTENRKQEIEQIII